MKTSRAIQLIFVLGLLELKSNSVFAQDLAHCEQSLDSLPFSLHVQEVQSPPGPRHSDGIVSTNPTGTYADGTTTGLVWFANQLVVPGTAISMGTQTGHCVQVWANSQLACYFNFDIQEPSGSHRELVDQGTTTTRTSNMRGRRTVKKGRSGRITAEALFDLIQFPNANLIITGGTGDFTGIAGHGCTQVPPEGFDGTSFIYNFNYKK